MSNHTFQGTVVPSLFFLGAADTLIWQARSEGVLFSCVSSASEIDFPLASVPRSALPSRIDVFMRSPTSFLSHRLSQISSKGHAISFLFPLQFSNDSFPMAQVLSAAHRARETAGVHVRAAGDAPSIVKA